MSVILNVNISNNLFTVSYNSINEKEKTFLQLRNGKNSYRLSILFKEKDYKICSPKIESINDFMKDMLERPQYVSTYHVKFNKKQYDLINETLFAFLLNDFIAILPVGSMIEKTIVTVEKEPNILGTERLKKAFHLVGLNNIILKFDIPRKRKQ